MERLAESDDHEVVRAVQEYFADFQVVNPDLMSLGISYPQGRLFGSSPELWNPDRLVRSTEGLLALLLSLKKKPMIRYSKNSMVAKKLATEVRYQMTQEEQLFDFRKVDTPPILLILDRREDPLTPLLTQWTYQAMVHELVGIHNGRVDLRDVPNVRSELQVSFDVSYHVLRVLISAQEVVLSQDQDPFFKKNMYANFGDLGQNAKDYVEQFASKSATSQAHNLSSIDDMKRFVEDYPEFRKLSGNVSKHVTLVGELSRRVAQDSLLDTSELEQSLACSDNHTADLRTLQQMIGNPTVPDASKVSLVAIYALRYANHPSNSLPMLRDLLGTSSNLSPADTALVPYLLAFSRSLHASPASSATPLPDLFSQPTALLSGARTRLQKGLKGVENVYTQHSPVLLSTLESLLRGRLSTATHPFLDGQGQTPREKPQDLVVFIVGGATYEEARVVAQVNASTPGVRIVLGGTDVINSTGFWEMVRGAVEGWPEVLREVMKEGGAGNRLGKEIGRR